MGRQWEPIRDLETRQEDVKQSELQALESVWRETRGRLEKLDAFRRFNAQLKREWAIETGLIEGLYVLDRGITQLLIERGLHVSLIPHGAVHDPETVVSMISDHEEVVDWLFDFVKGDRSLSTSYVKEIHSLITRHQFTVDGVDSCGRKIHVPLIRGDYKRLPNNPLRQDGELHAYCPPEHVSAEMDMLIEMHLAHVDVAPEVEAAWLHHRFTQIHPFQDGNGRVARALATLIFVRRGWFPLVVRNRQRGEYIAALEAADDGNLEPLVRYFANLQKDEFVKALSIAGDVLKSTRAEDAIRVARQRLRRRRDSPVEEWQTVRDTADALQARAGQRLRDVANAMTLEIQRLLEYADFFTDSEKDRDPRSHYFRFQIVETARKLDYFANMQTYRSWERLVMKNGNRSELVIAFHGIGHEFQGVLVCSACWFQKVETEEGRDVFDVRPVVDRVFQINYNEPLAQVEERFQPWLEQGIVRAIELWQATAL